MWINALNQKQTKTKQKLYKGIGKLERVEEVCRKWVYNWLWILWVSSQNFAIFNTFTWIHHIHKNFIFSQRNLILLNSSSFFPSCVHFVFVDCKLDISWTFVCLNKNPTCVYEDVNKSLIFFSDKKYKKKYIFKVFWLLFLF